MTNHVVGLTGKFGFFAIAFRAPKPDVEPSRRLHIGCISGKRQPLDLPVRSFCDADSLGSMGLRHETL
jgi:hypothetical protein